MVIPGKTITSASNAPRIASTSAIFHATFLGSYEVDSLTCLRCLGLTRLTNFIEDLQT